MKYKIFSISLLGVFLISTSLFAKEKKMPAFGMEPKKAQLELGKKVYTQYCSGCHGLNGEGNGPASKLLDPKPRNFRKAEYRFTSATSGSIPSDADLMRTINHGLSGTSMPGWSLLPESEKLALVAYLKSFAQERFDAEKDTLATVITEDPFKSNPQEGIEKGKNAYHGMAACYSCHAAYISPEEINKARIAYQMPEQVEFRSGLGASEKKENNDGFLIKPPDFTWDKIKSGNDVENLYRVIANGINGTAMPSWKGILSEEDIWGMAYYVRDLSLKRPRLITDQELKDRQNQAAEYEQARLDYQNQMKKAAEEKEKADDQKVEQSTQTS